MLYGTRACVFVCEFVRVTVKAASCVAAMNCLKFTETLMKCRDFWDLKRCRRVNNYERPDIPKLQNLHKNLLKNLKNGTEILVFRGHKCQPFVSSQDVFNSRQAQCKL